MDIATSVDDHHRTFSIEEYNPKCLGNALVFSGMGLNDESCTKCLVELSRLKFFLHHVRIIINGRIFHWFLVLPSFLGQSMNAYMCRPNGGLVNPSESLDSIKRFHVKGFVILVVVENVA